MLTVRSSFVALLVLHAASLVSFAAGEHSTGVPLNDSEALRGTWVPITGERGDEDKEALEQLPKIQVVFDGDTITVVYENAPELKRTFVIRPEKSPKELDMVDSQDGEKKTYPTIYKVVGDTLTICGDDLAKDRPTEFSVKGKKSFSMVTLKRKK